ncbi:Uma2 family endonuclease [Nocardiopsis sp. HNM0947]|uniref:Uma2 family endonuclease n=1 Tax=Nocardiopsis coralli TaxID=2772213 RepID=A0ABR9P5Z0_9ACTN|nr:Uma2 family endonuclease [Nocardiopsis coralli]MBE2999253.1 Uma2 family endonuclease [Nocardiopsis coralli]
MSLHPEVPPHGQGFDDWVVLPRAPYTGFTAEDLDRIPDLPPHTELIDGALVPKSPQSVFHMLVLRRFEDEMDRQIPAGMLTCRSFSLVLGERQRPEPDMMLVGSEAFTSMDDTWVAPEAVQLVVEVVSPDSKVRDHERKPQLYARAGIPHFWLAELEGTETLVVYTYELDPINGGYTMVGAYREHMKVEAPCALDIGLTQLRRTGRPG